MDNKKDKILIVFICTVFSVLCILVWLTPDKQYSISERRILKQTPAFNLKEISSGRFMNAFEDYSLDQFPLRDQFRSLKAFTSIKSDNNGIYVVDDVILSMEYPLKEKNLLYASQRFAFVYDTYLKDSVSSVYLSIIPDKNYFYAKKNGYLSLDYEKLVSVMKENNPFMDYIDIFPQLTGKDYYATDTHWKQEALVETAEVILEAMGTEEQHEYETVEMKSPFYGVYYGQAALPLPSDRISYLTNSVIENFSVWDHQNGKEIPVYDKSKMEENDPYELFLGGPLSLVTIENPACPNGKHLVIFRDSFGSSIAPLLAQEYEKTTLIDIRYMLPAVLGHYVDFQNTDVLFLYSTMVLNNSETIK